MAAIVNDRPTVIFNCDKKEVIGVFETTALASRYIAGYFTDSNFSGRVNKLLHKSIVNNGRIRKATLNTKCDIAARFASDKYIEQLDGREYFVTDGYPDFKTNKMIGFHDTAESFRRKLKTKQ